MAFVVCPLSIVPVRREPNDRAELVTQWLFGETAEVLERQEKWSRLRFHLDAYEGWVDNKQLAPAPEPNAADAPRSIDVSLSLELGGTKLLLPMGAVVRQALHVEGVIPLHGSAVEGHTTRDLTGPVNVRAMRMTRPFLGTPYLWGGRTPWGVDCSGFTQMVYLLAGLKLPRDAWQQALVGTPVERLANAKAGDLAFFSNPEGRVVHVGFVLPADNALHIVHASGMVRVDRLTEEGIVHQQDRTLTHRLSGIRRVV